MKLLSPTPSRRLNEAVGFLLLALGLLQLLSLVSYHIQDPSWNTAVGAAAPQNLTGYIGSYLADLFLQTFGITALLFPLAIFLLGWKWIRSDEIKDPGVKLFGFVLLGLSAGAAVNMGPKWSFFGLPAGGLVGGMVADWLSQALNFSGATILTLTSLIVSLYLVSTFTLAKLEVWFAGPIRIVIALRDRWQEWREERRRIKRDKLEERERQRAEERA